MCVLLIFVNFFYFFLSIWIPDNLVILEDAMEKVSKKP